MSRSIEELSKKRKRWVDANRENNFEEGIKRLLTDLYPDNAHFIFELLQNAEDPHAKVVRFNLTDKVLEFEHDGDRIFDLRDVDSITSIGVSTKRDDPTSIGKFGVGFKAVFAYTNTPEIHSGTIHFLIRDLVVPETINVNNINISDRKTRFVFPFDHPSKIPAQAVEEIERGLRGLSDNTLLFLNHIRTIQYVLSDGSLGFLERIDHKDGHIEIRARHPGSEDTVSHWLCFKKNVEVTDEDGIPKSCRIGIAYSLVAVDSNKKNHLSWKIVPLNQGQVSIYFPADKETSNLRFHIHAPFASTVARDSVRDCKANSQLRNYIAKLAVESFADIRDRGWLTMGFLAVLPNQTDNLSSFYEPIREAIVSAFSEDALTPTRSGGHASATSLYRGPARIAEVLNDDELSVLTNYKPPLWAANPPQQNQREDRFLDSLEIDSFGWDELIEILSTPYPSAWSEQQKQENTEHNETIEDWIEGKDDNGLMRLYALLGEACDSHYKCLNAKDLCIVRVEMGQGHEHVSPHEAFFPPELDTAPPEDIRFVKPTVYSSSRSEVQKKFARSFLEHIGVRPFDEKAAVKLRLAYYKEPPEQLVDGHYRDLNQFIACWKKNPNETDLFSGQTFLLGLSSNGELVWQSPENLCLDSPYFETGLGGLTDIHGKDEVWDGYNKNLAEKQKKDFADFLKAIGVMYELKVEKITCHKNPRANELRQDYRRPGVKWTYTAINDDYIITDLDKYLARQSIIASQLLWNALINSDSKSAKARFRPNQQYSIRETESQLVYHLKRTSWIPDKNGSFRKPEEITKDELHSDFLFNDRNELLTAIGFGERTRKLNQEYVVRNNNAQEMGFESADEAEKMAELALLLRNNGQSPDLLIAQIKPSPNKKQPSFPSKPVTNPERRQERLADQLTDSNKKKYAKRKRNVRATRGTIDPALSLRNQYTNGYGQMICQICKEEMPFKKRDGEYYFEAVEALSNKYFHLEHEAQYLALCPLCAARYKEFIKNDEDAMVTLREELASADGCDVPLKLGDLSISIRFVETHFHDLKVIIGESA